MYKVNHLNLKQVFYENNYERHARQLVENTDTKTQIQITDTKTQKQKHRYILVKMISMIVPYEQSKKKGSKFYCIFNL